MGAYNDLLIKGQCPVCGQKAIIRCQIHMAASFDGDDSGRFAVREYQMGETLSWWPPTDRRFSLWCERLDRVKEDGSVDECSYAGCESCCAELYVGVRFRDLVPVEVLEITTERPGWCVH